MNAITPVEASAEAGVDILAEFEVDAGIVLQDEKKAAAFYALCVAEVDAHKPDPTTKKGREAITSLATKIRNRKAAIDKARLALTSGWRDQTKAVNEAGKAAELRYQALEDRARLPLTDWQAEQDAKAARRKAAFDFLQNAPLVLVTDTSETLTKRLEEVRAYLLPNDFEPEDRDGCERLRGIATAALTTAIAEAQQKEQDARDLAAFRAAQAAAAPAPVALTEAVVAPQPLPPAPVAVAPPPPPAPASEDQTIAIMEAAAASLVGACSLDYAAARRVVLAIAKGQVAHLSIN